MRRKQLLRLIFAAMSVCSFALGMGAKLLSQKLPFVLLENLSTWLWMLSVSILVIIMLEWLLSYKIYKGFRYLLHYYAVLNSLELQMIDAGICIKRGNYIEIPKIYLLFENGFSKGILKIRNSLKFDKKFEDVVMSAALHNFIVERHFKTDDGNYFIYELIDGAVSFKNTFNSFEEFCRYNKKIPPYKLFLDNRSVVSVQHSLIVGMTGSGKSYFLYDLILQMIDKKVNYQLYFADPKGSSLAVIGSILEPERNAVQLSEIIELLEEFVTKMRERKTELKELLKTKLDSDYSYFRLEPSVFIFDEYASFSSVLASEDKKVRDKVRALISEVVLQGRQLGYFLFIVMQKSDATLIDTYIRDNIPLKVVLGNSEQQTYVTAFGTGVDIPNRNYMIGEGVFTEPVLAPEPKLVQCPFCNFDILGAISTRTPVL